MLEHLIDLIDKIDELIGNEGIYITIELYKEFFSKYMNQVLIEKSFFYLLDKNGESKEVIKFELYSLYILLSKGSFEAKINSKF
jgi:hypothetical protein